LKTLLFFIHFSVKQGKKNQSILFGFTLYVLINNRESEKYIDIRSHTIFTCLGGANSFNFPTEKEGIFYSAS
jgi:hypothetical protein